MEGIFPVEVTPLIYNSAKLLDLEQPFEIDTYFSDCAIGAILNQQVHPMAYHSETPLDTF